MPTRTTWRPLAVAALAAAMLWLAATALDGGSPPAAPPDAAPTAAGSNARNVGTATDAEPAVARSPATPPVVAPDRTPPIAPARLTVEVRGDDGLPLAGATCTLLLPADGADLEARATTGGDGLATLPAAEVATVHVGLDGFASVRHQLGYADRRTLARGQAAAVQVILYRAGALRVTVDDDAGRRRAGHALQLVYAGGEFAGRRWTTDDADRAGLPTEQRLWAGADGTLTASDLQPGAWEVGGLPWQDCERSGPVAANVRAGGLTACDLTVTRLPPENVAHGAVQVDGAEAAEGVLARFALEAECISERERPAESLPVYADGSYFIVGEPGDRFRVRLLQTADDGHVVRTSRWWDARCGAGAATVLPQWDG